MNHERIALVTGGSGGIGAAVCRALARDGLIIAVCDLDVAACEAVAHKLEGTGHRSARMDVTDEASVSQAFSAVGRELGPATVLVACAGIQRRRDPETMAKLPRGRSHLPTGETGLDAWNLTLTVNATGLFLAAREYIRQLPRDCRGGRIVTFSSVGAHVGSNVSGIDYVASKAAIMGMTKTLANELGPRGVTANCIAPGLIETGMYRASVPREADAELLKGVPLGHIGAPEDVAEAVRFLVSGEARYITGVTVDVNGGLRMQ